MGTGIVRHDRYWGARNSEPSVNGRPARVAVVLVSYNSADVLPGCLDSLVDQEVDLVRVVVADNASSDDSLKIAAERGALTVRVGRNAGYAAGFNAGVGALDLDALDAVCVL